MEWRHRMNKVKECFERIQVIRGVNYGQISHEQLNAVFTLYDLEEKQQAEVYRLLQDNGILPVNESELYKSVQVRASKKTSKKKTVTTAKTYEERYKEVWGECFETIKNDEKLINQYCKEIPVLKELILKYSTKYDNTPYKLITDAVMELSDIRSKEIRKKGWICGTYASQMKNGFKRWLSYNFSEDSVKRLICDCKEERVLGKKNIGIVIVLIHNTPRIMVHLRDSKFFTDEMQERKDKN